MKTLWQPIKEVKVSINPADQSIVFIHFTNDLVLRGDGIISAIWQVLPATFDQIFNCIEEEFEGTFIELAAAVTEGLTLLENYHLVFEESC